MCDLNVIKILVVGDVGVGKTSLFGRFFEDRVSTDYNKAVCQAEVAGKSVLDERRHDILRIYSDIHGAISDIRSLSSFHNVSHWLMELSVCPKAVNLVFVDNKYDELVQRQVTQEETARYAELHGLTFSEASAKGGANLRDVLGS